MRPGERRAPALARGTLHLWTVRIALDPRAVDDSLGRLTRAERAWAARLGSPGARARFVAARRALRALLGAYLGLEPTRVRLEEGPHGKPALRARRGARPLHFSVSHSGGLAVLAFSADGPVGVDVERLRPMPNALRLAERYLTRRERARVRWARGPAARSRAFLEAWTAKEALLKATGDGLAALGRAEVVRARPRGPLEGLVDGESRWRIHRIAPAPGLVGAVAVPRTT